MKQQHFLCSERIDEPSRTWIANLFAYAVVDACLDRRAVTSGWWRVVLEGAAGIRPGRHENAWVMLPNAVLGALFSTDDTGSTGVHECCEAGLMACVLMRPDDGRGSKQGRLFYRSTVGVGHRVAEKTLRCM